MTPNALEEMVNALEENPGCDLAHCKLKIIDENGAPYPKLIWDKFYCAAFFGDLINQKHIRLAPHDGLLHCGVKTVYTSITQLLIRKSLFDRIGLFLTNYGSIADFEWEMRASLVANTIHIPAYLATWRVHHSQGTDQDFLHSSKYRTQLLKLIDHAFDKAKKKNPTLLKGIKKKELKAFYLTEKLRWEIKEQRRQANSKFYKYKTVFKWLLMKPKLLLKYYRYSLAKSKNKQKAFNSLLEPLAFSRKLLRKYGFEDNIKIIN
jgi:GT2 family glycosyltransferase